MVLSRGIRETHLKSGSHDAFLEAPGSIQYLPIKNCEVETNQMIEDFTLYGLRKFAMAEKSRARCARRKHTLLSSLVH